MKNFSGPRGLRRIPALLLIPTLLAMGMESSRVPDREAKADSMTQDAHAQVMRAPTVRTACSAVAPLALPILRYTIPMAGWIVQGGVERDRESAVAARQTPTHHSRAPPVTL
jgi:hypothetical protein